MENLQNYIKRVVGTPVDYDGVYGHQCVDLVKDFSEKIFGVKLGSFGGSAKTGALNKAKTFDLEKWKNFLIGSEKLQAGDFLFHTRGKYGHVAIFLEYLENGKIKILEQNAGTGTGKGKTNFVKTSEVDENIFEKVYRFKNFQAQTESKKELTEFEKLLEEAKNVGIWNGKDGKKLTPREEAVTMAYFVYKTLKKDFEILKKDLEKFKKGL